MYNSLRKFDTIEFVDESYESYEKFNNVSFKKGSKSKIVEKVNKYAIKSDDENPTKKIKLIKKEKKENNRELNSYLNSYEMEIEMDSFEI